MKKPFLLTLISTELDYFNFSNFQMQEVNSVNKEYASLFKHFVVMPVQSSPHNIAKCSEIG